MPGFMRQPSGGRSNSNSRDSKGGRAPGGMGGKQPKAIQTPQCEQVKLNRSENAWDLSGNTNEMKVIYRYNLFTVKI